MKIIFMGTPDFSVGTLKALISAGHEITLVVTQPDKPKGRGNVMQYSPVKEVALEYGLPVYQPKKIREPECIDFLKQYEADIFVVIAFGQILTKEILEMPKYGCINVHASLLPKYRGAAPIQWAVINGEETTGVTTMRMDEGIDTGDMILSVEVPVDKKETGGSLFDKLEEAGAKLCVETLAAIESGTAAYTPQNHEQATTTRIIHKKLGLIDFKKSAVEIERMIRGLNPWPSAYTKLNGKILKIWEADVKAAGNGIGTGADAAGNGTETDAGTVVFSGAEGIGIQTGQGILVLKEVQLEGRKRMSAEAFLRGAKVPAGTKFS